MKSYNEHFDPYSKTLFPEDFKKEDTPNATTYMCKPNNFMQSNCSDPFLKCSTPNPVNFPIATIWSVRPSKRPFLLGRKEQAEVGQSPTLLAICAANGVLRILRGYFTAFLPAKKKKTGYLAVSCIDI
jgi:hypothetical protein